MNWNFYLYLVFMNYNLILFPLFEKDFKNPVWNDSLSILFIKFISYINVYAGGGINTDRHF